MNKACGESHHIIVAHVNASDGCIDLNTTLSRSVPMSLAPDTTPSTSTRVSTVGMNFYRTRTSEGDVIHWRNKIKSISKSTPSGRALSRSLANMGYLPTMGVSEPLCRRDNYERSVKYNAPASGKELQDRMT